VTVLTRRTLVLGGLAGLSGGLLGCTAAVPGSEGGPSSTARTPLPAPSGAVAGSRPWFGLNVPYAAEDAVADLSARIGEAPLLMSRFVKLDSTFDLPLLASTGGHGGRVPLLTLEPWSHALHSGDVDRPAYSLQTLSEGRHDAALTAIARVLGAYGDRVLVRFAHEMNADWYPWAASVNGNSAELYVAAWRHVVGLVSALAPQVEWVWSPVAAWWEDQQPLRALYPGDDVVDFVGATGYGRSASAEETFGAWREEVRAFTRRPALLAETGATGPQKVAWMGSLAAFLNDHPDIKGFVWFNTSPESTGASGDYRIDDSAAHLEAFRRLLQATSAVGSG
jgi:hypothetical protein